MAEENKIKLGKVMYNLEAGLEYLVSILVTGSFLAKLTSALGMSDGLTGILSAISSLGCLFGILSVSIRMKSVKKLVVLLSVFNQCLFFFLYCIPLISLSTEMKNILFVSSMFLAYFAFYIVHPKKINWLMSLVSDERRGIFTANKEILSLLMGMAFSYLMGCVMDYYTGQDEILKGFRILASVLFLLMVLHTTSMLLTIEKPLPVLPKETKKESFFVTVKGLLKNKGVRNVAIVFLLYYISCNFTSPFLGTYQNNELGFSLRFVAILGMVNAVVRIFFSKPMGHYADEKSFPAMLEICLWMTALAFVSSMFSFPGKGSFIFVFHYIFAGLGGAGISNAMTSMVFSYVTVDKRADALAITLAVAGAGGFLSTVVASRLIEWIQQNGSTLLGVTVYAQQVHSLISIFLQLAAIFYLRKTLK